MIPLVLLPGMMCDARLWAPQMGALKRRAVLHAPCTEADTMEALAARVLTVAPDRFALAGLSMGGIVAMEVVRQAPGRVDRIALLDTNPLPEPEAVRADRVAQIGRARAGGLAGVMRERLERDYLAAGSDATEVLDLCMAMAIGLGTDVFERQSRALASRPDQRATLAAFRGPALVLMGAEDRLCPRDRHELMHALMPQSRLVVVDRAGHLPTLERPAETTAALMEWLAD